MKVNSTIEDIRKRFASPDTKNEPEPEPEPEPLVKSDISERLRREALDVSTLELRTFRDSKVGNVIDTSEAAFGTFAITTPPAGVEVKKIEAIKTVRALYRSSGETCELKEAKRIVESIMDPMGSVPDRPRVKVKIITLPGYVTPRAAAAFAASMKAAGFGVWIAGTCFQNVTK